MKVYKIYRIFTESPTIREYRVHADSLCEAYRKATARVKDKNVILINETHGDEDEIHHRSYEVKRCLM